MVVLKKYFLIKEMWDNASRNKKIKVFLGIYTGVFLISFLMVYSLFFVSGKTFIWNIDGRGQHYPVLIYVGQYLRTLIQKLFQLDFLIPLFDLNISLGADIIATLNYNGFGDPLNLVSVFVPIKYSDYLYDFLLVFRVYLAGVAFSALCIFHQKQFKFILVGVLVYIYSGFAIYSTIRHPYFINPMIQFPLLILGVDKILEKKKSFIFVGTVFYSALCGFYFLYMMSIMLGIYVLVYFTVHYSRKQLKEFLRTIGKIAMYYLLGIGMAAPLFIPAVIGYLTSSRANYGGIHINLFSYGWLYYLARIMGTIAPPCYWDSLTVASITLLAVVILFFSRQKKHRSLRVLFLIATVVYAFPVGGYIMNGFGYPSYRWTFGFVLLLSYIVVEMMPTMLNLTKKQKVLCILSLFFYIVLFFTTKSRSVNYRMGIICLAVTVVLLLVVNTCISRLKCKQEMRQSIGACVCLLVVALNVCVISTYSFVKTDELSMFTKRGTESKWLNSSIDKEMKMYLDDCEGRCDSTSFFAGRGMVWHVPEILASWSIGNSYLHDFWNQTENIKLTTSSALFYSADQRTIMNALLSVKHYIDKEERCQNVPYGYEIVQKTESGNILYENQYALPWGYTYDSYIPYTELKQMNGIEKEGAMLQSIALENNVVGIKKGEIQSNIKNIPYKIMDIKDAEWEEGVFKVKKQNAAITLEFEMPAYTEGYIRLQGFNINGSGQSYFRVNVECGDVSKSAQASSNQYTWYFGREDYSFNLGYSEKECTTCTIIFPATGWFWLKDIQVLAVPMNGFSEKIAALKEDSLQDIRFSENKINGNINLDSSKILCMSIPYSKGWTAKVDGEPVEILRGNIMFMALVLPEGYHEIEFTYFTPGLKAGIIIFIISCSLLFCIHIFQRWKKKENK